MLLFPHCGRGGTSGEHSVRGGGCGFAPSDCWGAARARLPRELAAGKRSRSCCEKCTPPPLPGPGALWPRRVPPALGGLGAEDEPAAPSLGVLDQPTQFYWEAVGPTGSFAVFRLLQGGPADFYYTAMSMGCVIGFQFDLVTSPR